MPKWGVGVNTDDEDYVSYGFPESSDPTKFHPDVECCTKQEIKNHALALKEYQEHKNIEESNIESHKSRDSV